MSIRYSFPNHLLKFTIIALAIFLLGGCLVKLVDDYDSSTFEEILQVGKKVDKFYGDLLEVNSDERAYQKFRAQYVEIEVDIRSLVTRNKIRALNEESTQISETILKLWLKYKDAHKANDTYSDGTARLDRERFFRLFVAAASAERAKKLTADDKDPTKNSK